MLRSALIGALVAVSSSGVPVPQATAAHESAADAPHVVRVHREYGDGPVRIRGADKVQVVFHARPGDRVRLGGAQPCPVRLAGPDRTSVVPAGGFWRVRARGLHVFTFQRCSGRHDERLQLQKLLVREGRVDGPPVALDVPRGYLGGVRIRVPRTRPLHIGTDYPADSGTPFEALVRADGSVIDLHDYSIVAYDVTPGYRIRSSYGSQVAPDRIDPGERLLLVAGESQSVWLSRPQVVPVSVDGPPVSVPVGTPPYRPFLAEFQGTEGSWVHLEVGGEDLFDFHSVLGPDTYLYQTNGWIWQVPRTGTYRYLVQTGTDVATLPVRVRSTRQLPTPMPTDGTDVTFDAGPGEWVMATLTLPDTAPYRLSTHAAAVSTDWQAVAFGTGTLDCGRGPNGCGDYTYGSVDQDHPESGIFGLLGGLDNPYHVLLRLPSDGSGSVNLAVAATGPPPT